MQLTILICSILFVAALHAWRMLWVLGHHRPVFNHEPGPCRHLDQIANSSSDFHVLLNGRVLITSVSDVGRVYLYDLAHPEVSAQEVTLDSEYDVTTFTPHAITAHEDEHSGVVTVFIISRHPLGDRIEKFIFHYEQHPCDRYKDALGLHAPSFHLEHVQTIRDDTLTVGESIHAIGTDSFYFTNKHQHSDDISVLIETYLMFSWGTLVFCQPITGQGYRSTMTSHFNQRSRGSKCEAVVRGYMPSGVVLSPDKRYLYLSLSGSQEIKVYERHSSESDQHLYFIMSLPVSAHVTRLTVSRDGARLVAAAGNSLAEELSHTRNTTHPCGSRVFQIEADMNGMLGNLKELYANDGSDLNCANKAMVYERTLLIGSPSGPPLICKICDI